jgi:superfamily II DNA or RNA helicase
MTTFHGFNKIRYAEYQSTCKEFYDALEYTIKYFKTMEGKMMILSSTIDNTEVIKKFIDDKFPDATTSVYHSKISAEEKNKAMEADIISTTPKSAGTGVDIPGLRTVIMTESYSSTVQADQVSGRLREYSEHDKTFYVELVDVGFKKVYNMYKNRLPIFKKKCAKILSVEV